MARHPNSLSVLIVDNTPQILISLARLFRTNNIRALLAAIRRKLAQSPGATTCPSISY